MRDILGYFKIIEFEPFKFNELAKHLLDTNQALQLEFKDSPIPKSYRIHSKKSYIEKRVSTLIKAGIIKEAGKSATKNKQQTALFKFSQYAVLLLMKIDGTNSTLEEKFIQAMTTALGRNSTTKFYLTLLKLLYARKEHDYFLELANDLQMGRPTPYALFFPWLEVVEIGDTFLLSYRNTSHEVFSSQKRGRGIVLEALKSMDNQSRELLLHEIKRDIEGLYYWHATSQAFELERMKNAGNSNQVVFQTKCKSCRSLTPRSLTFKVLFSRHTGKIDAKHRFDCSQCDEKSGCEFVRLDFAFSYSLPLPSPA